MLLDNGKVTAIVSLIETWDVLKSTKCTTLNFAQNSLIETWDVLKSGIGFWAISSIEFNRNMGCIEIHSTVIR